MSQIPGTTYTQLETQAQTATRSLSSWIELIRRCASAQDTVPAGGAAAYAASGKTSDVAAIDAAKAALDGALSAMVAIRNTLAG